MIGAFPSGHGPQGNFIRDTNVIQANLSGHDLAWAKSSFSSDTGTGIISIELLSCSQACALPFRLHVLHKLACF